MEKTKTHIPDNYLIVYKQETEKKTFIEFRLKSADKPLLTELIRIERNNGYNQIKGANYLLRIRDKTNWQKCSLAGLRETKEPNYYYSDLLFEGVKSLMVIKVIRDFEIIEIRFCRKFYPKDNPRMRAEIVNYIISNWNVEQQNNPVETEEQKGQLKLF